MNKKQFATMLFVLSENFNFKIENRYWIDLIYNEAKKFSDEELRYGFGLMYNITSEEWNTKYGYRGKPTIADLIIFFGKKRKRDKMRKKSEESRKQLAAIREKHIKESQNIVVLEPKKG